MVDVSIMIEGQQGLTWDRWKRIGRTVESLGFDGLFRSDHFTDPEGPVQDALELWTSLTWLADNTDDLAFGPLVTPLSFRDPVFTARMAKEVDNLSGGRLVLGLGAGWQEREHEMFGYNLLPLEERFDRFEEGVKVVAGLLRTDEPLSFDGEYYELQEADLRPRPRRDGGPPLLVGGNGRRRTIPIAARFADEWNAVYRTPEQFETLSDHLDTQLERVGRKPTAVRRSLMTRIVYGRTEAELEQALGGQDPSDLRALGNVVGTAPDVIDHLDRLAESGADRVMLQWLALDDLDRLEGLATEVL